ncbi:MAG: hypothetical protein IPF64_03145 [Flavobacteriales bacterium]|nr:hypothetical protein [Flavobacteriales bacterium]
MSDNDPGVRSGVAPVRAATVTVTEHARAPTDLIPARCRPVWQHHKQADRARPVVGGNLIRD